MESLLRINGTHLFVDERGPADGPPLLYLHGGPGQSCWDFMASVGDRIADRGIRLIGVDQRGVLRSDALAEGTEITVRDLIADFEALRVELDIPTWSILGHSAGGGYALDYALQHPDHIRSAVFDCPSWDCDATDRERLPVAADLLAAAGHEEAAATCRADAACPDRLSFTMERLTAMQTLGAAYMRLFTYDRDTEAAYVSLAQEAPKDLDWARGASHLPLAADMYADRVPGLTNLEVPSLLVHGETDLVAPPSVVERYRRLVHAPHGVATIPQAGHFAFAEQPERYVEAVADFVLRACGAIAS